MDRVRRVRGRKAPRRPPAEEPKAEPTLEPLEPGGEVGETREVGPRSSAERLPGRAPRTRTVVHPRGRAEDQPRH